MSRLLIEKLTGPDGGYVEIEAFLDGPVPYGDDWLVVPSPAVDGFVVGGKFYPFMVDGERNPALEWQLEFIAGDGWKVGIPGREQIYLDKGFACRWVAVGVKDTH